jgi:hypothetical protein
VEVAYSVHSALPESIGAMFGFRFEFDFVQGEGCFAGG